MSVGQRIAQKRKEMGLSQEALGEQLGVSRQAIYKWESDATMPEVEKLIALSRIFSVSVGWLLGVEESETPSDGNDAPQTDLVEEVLRRYQDAQPAPAKRRVWPFVLAGLALVIVFVSLFSRLNTLQQNYANLQNSISRIDHNVQQDVNNIATRVEEILKQQNHLTAEYSAEISSYDLSRHTVTFALSAVPKTYIPGMTAVFTARSGADTTQVEGVLGDHNRFSADLACPISDDITLSVVFSADEKEETQLLKRYDWLRQFTLPLLYVSSDLFGYNAADRDGYLTHTNTWIHLLPMDWDEERFGAAPQPQSIRVGLFADRKLLAWYEAAEHSADMPIPVESTQEFELHEKILLSPDVTYCVVAFATDQYGQQITVPEGNYQYVREGNLLQGIDSDFTGDIDWITE